MAAMTNKVKPASPPTGSDGLETTLVTLKTALSWAWLLGFHHKSGQWSDDGPGVPEEGLPEGYNFFREMNRALQDGTRTGCIHKAKKEILMLEKQRVAANCKVTDTKKKPFKVKDTHKKPNVSQKKTKKKG